MEVPIENLLPILNSANGYKKIQIENSPHFKLIKSYEQKQKLDISDYVDYYAEYFPNENIEEKIQKFIDLLITYPMTIVVCLFVLRKKRVVLKMLILKF